MSPFREIVVGRLCLVALASRDVFHFSWIWPNPGSTVDVAEERYLLIEHFVELNTSPADVATSTRAMSR